MDPIYVPDLKGVIGGSGIFLDADYSDKYHIADEENGEDPHIHSFCEVYFNINGDVSFAVENNLYNIEPGDIIITKPNEFHKCIYHSDGVHEHYCMWISSEESLMQYLKCFYERKNGDRNLIRLKKSDREKLREALNILMKNRGTENFNSAESLSSLFLIINILNENRNETSSASLLPGNFSRIVEYIDGNFTLDCSVNNITELFYISRSSLNRLFKQYLGTTPSKYVETRRLAAAKELLRFESSVQAVAVKCGFSDYSHFISLFKKRFGITPHKYRKENK